MSVQRSAVCEDGAAAVLFPDRRLYVQVDGCTMSEAYSPSALPGKETGLNEVTGLEGVNRLGGRSAPDERPMMLVLPARVRAARPQ